MQTVREELSGVVGVDPHDATENDEDTEDDAPPPFKRARPDPSLEGLSGTNRRDVLVAREHTAQLRELRRLMGTDQSATDMVQLLTPLRPAALAAPPTTSPPPARRQTCTLHPFGLHVVPFRLARCALARCALARCTLHPCTLHVGVSSAIVDQKNDLTPPGHPQVPALKSPWQTSTKNGQGTPPRHDPWKLSPPLSRNTKARR